MRIPLLIIILFSTTQFYLQADVRYVSKTGSNIPPYLSWETAADSIQACISICDDGDTIYVANGIYRDSLSINKSIYLIGSSADSTILDGSELATRTIVVSGIEDGGSIQNFTVIGASDRALLWLGKGILVKDCRLYHGYLAIGLISGSLNVENVIIKVSNRGIDAGCYSNNCISTFKNNIIIINNEGADGIHLDIGGDYYIYNNIILFTSTYYNPMDGIGLGWPRKVYIYNNLIYGFETNIYTDLLDDTMFVFNNILTGNKSIGIDSHQDKAQVRNNIFYQLYNALDATSYFEPNYNLFFGNKTDLLGSVTYHDSDLVARDPMFVKDSPIDTNLSFDFHFQKYSPAIDKGDPTILDKDGTRSDLGIYGGPFGEEYTYEDYKPRAPVNLTATVFSGKINMSWNKNSGADTAYYSLYLDSTANFTIDSIKLISTQTSNLYNYQNPQFNKHYYFKLTATDKQGNVSNPSEELHIFVTSTGEKNYPIEVSDYKLYQNYPNPFNPTTVIPYRLKERGYVKLMVYDIKGELIKVLVNKEQERGYYEEHFDGKDLSSGIYLYRIEIIGKGNIPVYSDMKKTILIK